MIDVQTCNCGEVTEEELYAMLDEVLEDYYEKPGALIPILQIAQRMFGFLPERALKQISLKMNKSYSEVAGVVSFYSFFTRVPKGKYNIRVCLGTACYVRGGKDLLLALEKELHIKVGETTEDRLFSIDVGRCFGACGLAPVLMVNDIVHQRVKPDKVGDVVAFYKNEDFSKVAQ